MKSANFLSFFLLFLILVSCQKEEKLEGRDKYVVSGDYRSRVSQAVNYLMKKHKEGDLLPSNSTITIDWERPSIEQMIGGVGGFSKISIPCYDDNNQIKGVIEAEVVNNEIVNVGFMQLNSSNVGRLSPSSARSNKRIDSLAQFDTQSSDAAILNYFNGFMANPVEVNCYADFAVSVSYTDNRLCQGDPIFEISEFFVQRLKIAFHQQFALGQITNIELVGTILRIHGNSTYIEYLYKRDGTSFLQSTLVNQQLFYDNICATNLRVSWVAALENNCDQVRAGLMPIVDPNDPCSRAKAALQEVNLIRRFGIFIGSYARITGSEFYTNKEHAIAFGIHPEHGFLAPSEMTIGGPHSVTVPNYNKKLGDIHNHTTEAPPSSGDIYSFIDQVTSNNDFKMRFVIMPSGIVYALVATDKAKAAAFKTKYPKVDNPGYEPGFPDDLVDDFIDIQAAANNSQEVALAFFLNKYKVGVDLLKLEGMNGQFDFKTVSPNQTTGPDGRKSYSVTYCP